MLAGLTSFTENLWLSHLSAMDPSGTFASSTALIGPPPLPSSWLLSSRSPSSWLLSSRSPSSWLLSSRSPSSWLLSSRSPSSWLLSSRSPSSWLLSSWLLSSR